MSLDVRRLNGKDWEDRETTCCQWTIVMTVNRVELVFCDIHG